MARSSIAVETIPRGLLRCAARAIGLEDSIVFSEPWGWMQPVRHAYAALSLEQGDLEEAAEAYKVDLGLNKNLY